MVNLLAPAGVLCLERFASLTVPRQPQATCRRKQVTANVSNRGPRLAVTLAVLLVLLVPILVYGWVFGTELSRDHQRWSEMGSAMSGIYTPLLTLLTFAVLLAQVRLQASMTRHTFDQSFVQQARDTITFSLEQLAKEMSQEVEDGSDIKRLLVGAFAYASAERLAEPTFIEVAKSLNQRHHRLISFWSEFYSAMAALRVHDFDPYSTTFTSMKQRAIAVLSYEGCAALDNLVWCVSEGRLNYGYEFPGANLPAREVVSQEKPPN